MAATGFHGEQINIFYDQLSRYFEINEHIHVGIDNFIYYLEGDIEKCVAPDIYVVLGVNKFPLRRSFYARCSSSHPSSDTWEEGAVPAAVFEFLSDSTANQDRTEKVRLYLIEMEVEEYFIHQPELEKPSEFRGWRRSTSEGFAEIAPDEAGGLFSESLNLWFSMGRTTERRKAFTPYLSDGTPITTSIEEHQLRLEAQEMAATEAERRRAAEAELERLRAQLATRQDEGA